MIKDLINTYLTQLSLCLLVLSSFFLSSLIFAPNLMAQDTLRIDSTATDSSKANKMSAKGNKMANANPNRDSLPIIKIDSTKIDSTKVDSSKKAETPPEKAAKKPKPHSAKRALRWAIIPGGGQIYNRRYWKLPIVYAGVGGFAYWYISSRSARNCYQKAYSDAVDTDPTTNYICPRDPLASSRVLLLQRDYYRSQSEFALLGGLLFYGLTMADAFVDAHLKSFDMSDDLSLKIRPKIQFSPENTNFNTTNFQPQFSIALSFNIHPKTK
jgi:hypothetical protein